MEWTNSSKEHSFKQKENLLARLVCIHNNASLTIDAPYSAILTSSSLGLYADSSRNHPSEIMLRKLVEFNSQKHTRVHIRPIHLAKATCGCYRCPFREPHQSNHTQTTGLSLDLFNFNSLLLCFRHNFNLAPVHFTPSLPWRLAIQTKNLYLDQNPTIGLPDLRFPS